MKNIQDKIKSKYEEIEKAPPVDTMFIKLGRYKQILEWQNVVKIWFDWT